MKKLIMTGMMLAAFACTACSAPKPAEPAATAASSEAPAEKTPEATATPAPAEKTPEPTAETKTAEVPAELEGTYAEEIAGRGNFTLAKTETGAHLDVSWSSSAFETTHWDIDVTYDEEKNALVYENAVKTNMVFESGDKHTDTEEYNDGTGYFEIGDGTLTWYDDMEKDRDPAVFRKVDQAGIGMPNPWTETADLAEALSIAGLEFDPPIPEALPTGEHEVALKTYMAMPGTVTAVYEGQGGEMQVRKALKFTGDDLSGDYNTYSKTWEENFKGLTVKCEGDGTTVNKALFAVGDDSWSVSFNAGEEGKGLTVSELQSLIMGMQ